MSKRQQPRQDYVKGLITGRWVSVTNIEGKVIQIFKPFTDNPNPPLSKLINDETSESEKDRVLVLERLRLPLLTLSQTWFKKDFKDKSYLKHLKKVNKAMVRKAGFDPKTRLNPEEPVILRK